MFTPFNSLRCAPGLAGAVPIGMRHAAAGIRFWPRAIDAQAVTSANIVINRLICKVSSLLGWGRNIIQVNTGTWTPDEQKAFDGEAYCILAARLSVKRVESESENQVESQLLDLQK